MATVRSELARAEERIASGLERDIQTIQEFLRMPHSGPELREAAQAVVQYLKEIGCQRTEVFGTAGNPIVYGELQVEASETVIVYLMYDTAPVLDANEWLRPPYGGEIVDLPVGRAILGRGSMARRGPLVAFFGALRAIRQAGLQVPVNMLFVAEGDENVGSPYLSEFYAAYRERLAPASATLFPAATQESNSSVSIKLGAKGMLGLELVCDGAAWKQGPGTGDLHWGEAAWVDSPMWRLAHSLTTLASPDGSRVTIDGFYDNVLPPTGAERELADKIPFDAAQTRAKLGIAQFSAGVDGLDAFLRNLYEPSVLLEGAWGSIPPLKRLYRTAISRIDFRLIRRQTADEIEEKVRTHLARRGFEDITVIRKYSVPYSQVDPDAAIVRATVDTYRNYSIEPELWPSQPKTPPVAVFERPYVMVGVAHGGNHAARNEYLLLEANGRLYGLADLERSFVQLLFRYAELKRDGMRG